MRKITNKTNLPAALVAALYNDRYSKGRADYSTTELCVPSRIVALKEKHKDEIEEDAADLIYALLGKLGHSILEEAGTAEMIEKRLFHTFEDGTILSGCMDIVDKTIIEDWKFTSIWTGKNGVKFEWEAQASVNAFLCHKNSVTVSGARYIAIYRDWSATRVERGSDYPKHQVQVFDVPIWPLNKTEAWIKERIASHNAAKRVLPECSPEDRWARNSGVAVMKKGRKTAVKLFPDESQALEFISKQEDQNILSTQVRKGDSLRCRYYCQVAPFCDFWKAIKTESSEDAF